MKLRMLVANSRGLAAAAVAALALGIGITSLMFAIVDGTVRRGLPVIRPGEIVHLDLMSPADERRRTFRNDHRQALEQASALSALAGYLPAQVTIAADGLTPRGWASAIVTANTFDTLGVQASQGHVFDGTAGQTTGGTPIVISDHVWRQQFSGDRGVIGRVVRANGAPAVIAAVMPPGFRFPFDHHVWLPADERGRAAMLLWGRLAPGISKGEAEERLSATYARIAERDVREEVLPRVTVTPFTEFLQGPQSVELLEMMFLAGVGVLAIACANVANLLLARGLARRRDFAIAGALGASRARVMRERIVEALALAAPGALAGVVLTYAGAAIFSRAIQASSPPYWVAVTVDVRVVVFASAAAVLSALVASALPAWRSGTAALGSILADESRGTTAGAMRRTTAVLVFVEIALATGVLIAAGLMTKGIVRLGTTEYPFALDDVSTSRVTLPARTYPDAASRRAFYERLHAGLAQLPGTQAALGSSFPFAFDERVPFALDRHAAAPVDQWPSAHRVAVSPGYFSTLGARMIGGRDFEWSDRIDRAPVAIVNLSFALRHARREEVIGRTLRLRSSDAPPLTIIGVVPDLAVGNARGEDPEAVYVALLQQPTPPAGVSILTRPARADGSTERQVRAVLAGLNRDLPLDRVTTIAAFRETTTWYYRVFGFLFLSFGLGALVLALVGVYAVMSFGVTRRRREIGTRMAIGATRRDIARLFLLEGSARVAAGLAAGVLLAAWLAPRLSFFLFRVSPRDPAVYTAAAAIVAAVALVACILPALRAARLDPNACLREE